MESTAAGAVAALVRSVPAAGASGAASAFDVGAARRAIARREGAVVVDGRGFDSTSAAAHNGGAGVSLFIFSW